MLTNLFILLIFTGYLPTHSYSFTNNPVNDTYENYEEIDPCIDDLYFSDENIRLLGSDNLLELAKTSEQFKQSVIKALIRVLEDDRLLEDKQTARYETWCRAAYLLGELKATQAITALKKELLENKRSAIRIASAQALGTIHTQGAKEILLTAFSREKDREVLKAIELELAKWNELIILQ